MLATHRDRRCHASEAEIAAALAGNWREEHVFALGQALELYDAYRAIDAKVWMLDLGRSFEKLCRKAKGTYIEFRPELPRSPVGKVLKKDIRAEMLERADKAAR